MIFNFDDTKKAYTRQIACLALMCPVAILSSSGKIKLDIGRKRGLAVYSGLGRLFVASAARGQYNQAGEQALDLAESPRTAARSLHSNSVEFLHHCSLR